MIYLGVLKIFSGTRSDKAKFHNRREPLLGLVGNRIEHMDRTERVEVLEFSK